MIKILHIFLVKHILLVTAIFIYFRFFSTEKGNKNNKATT